MVDGKSGKLLRLVVCGLPVKKMSFHEEYDLALLELDGESQ